MNYLTDGLLMALKIIVSCDKQFFEIVFVSIKVSFISTLLASSVGIPLGIFLAQKKFPGRGIILTIINSLMSLPTVAVGLMLYAFLSRQGPLGHFGLLYTLSAMVIGQFILILPITTGLTISAVKTLDRRVAQTIIALGANSRQRFRMFIHEAQPGILAAIIAGFSRVFAEVGVSMMLGGNIKGYTRNITTAIALETSKGEFALGIALGIVLLTVAFAINVFLTTLHKQTT
ncbi:MAG: ABC transporter permease subunit [Candidatus Omnitrophica bacterium]|nr:ABC transporter permease subunit [Candidatus Omnitrophota bacterium]